MTMAWPTSAQPAGPTDIGVVLDVAADRNTGIYIAGNPDTSPYRVFHFTGTSTVADRSYGRPDLNAPGPGFSFYAPNTIADASAVAVEPDGGLYVGDEFLWRVLHFSGTSTTADRIYGRREDPNVSPLPFALQMQPTGLAVDPSGGLYVVSSYFHRAVHYPGTSTTPDRVYGQPVLTAAAVQQPSATSLTAPQHIAIDPNGGVYISDTAMNRVLHYPGTSTTADRVYGQNGNFRTFKYGSGPGDLNQPWGLATDSSGLYIADYNNQRVLHYPGASTVPDRVYGQPDFSSKVGRLPDLGLSYPKGLAVDPLGGLYVTTAGACVVHYSGTNTTPDRIYGKPSSLCQLAGGRVPTPGPQAAGASPTPSADTAAPPAGGAPAESATPGPASRPDWIALLSASTDSRLNVGPCPSPADTTQTELCVNGGVVDVDLVTYGDIGGDGTLEAVIPIVGSGPMDQIGSLVYRVEDPNPQLLVADGPGGYVYIDATANRLVSVAPDPAGSCSALPCSDGMLRATYTLIDDNLVQESACTYVPDPGDPRLAQGDCTAVT